MEVFGRSPSMLAGRLKGDGVSHHMRCRELSRWLEIPVPVNFCSLFFLSQSYYLGSHQSQFGTVT